jgi:transposase
MRRDELERLSKAELIELVLRLQRPAKTPRTSSKPPSTDPKERRAHAKPGGAKPGHEGHSRALSTTPDRVIDHAPPRCPCCRLALSPDLPSEAVSVHERIELPQIRPVIEHHRRLAVQCPGGGARVVAAPPPAATGTPFGPRLHALATYLKAFQSLSYERLQATLADLFGLPISQGGLMNMLRRAQACFQAGRERAVAALRQAEVVASDETGVRVEGGNAYHWVFRCKEAVVHHAAPTRAASVVHAMMDGQPARGLAVGPPLGAAGARRGPADVSRASRPRRRLRAGGERRPAAVPAQALACLGLRVGGRRRAPGRLHGRRQATRARSQAGRDPGRPSGCELARALQAKLRRARDQLLTFVDWPGQVAATNNACERDLRPAVIQRKATNGYRAMWAAEGGAAEGSARGSAWKGSGGEADIRTVVDTARLKPGASVFGTILRTVSA